MRNRKLWTIVTGLLFVGVLGAGQAFCQPGGGAPGGGGPGGGRRFTFDPNMMRAFDANQWRKTQSDQTRDRLGATEEEWTVLEPKIDKVNKLAMEARGGGMMGMGMFVMGMGPGGGESEVLKASQALAKVLKDKDAASGDIKSALQALREARAKAKTALEAAQAELRAVLTLRQEALLVQSGTLD